MRQACMPHPHPLRPIAADAPPSATRSSLPAGASPARADLPPSGPSARTATRWHLPRAHQGRETRQLRMRRRRSTCSPRCPVFDDELTGTAACWHAIGRAPGDHLLDPLGQTHLRPTLLAWCGHPTGDCVEVNLRDSVPPATFARGQPTGPDPPPDGFLGSVRAPGCLSHGEFPIGCCSGHLAKILQHTVPDSSCTSARSSRSWRCGPELNAPGISASRRRGARRPAARGDPRWCGGRRRRGRRRRESGQW